MALATTLKFEQLVLELETDTPGTYAKICGLVGVTVNYSSEVEETEVPDCSDESLPLVKEKTVRSTDWSVSADGVWAATSHESLFQWWKGGAAKNVRISYSAATVGDVEIVSGAALLTGLTHTRAKGQKVTATIELTGNGAVTTTDQS